MPKDRENKVSCQNFIYEMEVALEVVSGKWKAVIIWNLYEEEVIRFNEFLRIIPGITQKMLTQQLRNLEHANLINRKVYQTVPATVEYSLTPLGEELIPILKSLNSWGQKYIEMYDDIDADEHNVE